MGKNARKLALNVETLRNLQRAELSRIAGGAIGVGHQMHLVTGESVCVCHEPNGAALGALEWHRLSAEGLTR